MAHSFLSRALPAAAILATAGILAASVRFEAAPEPSDRRGDALSVVAETAPEASEPTLAETAERRSEAAEPQAEALAEWTPRALSAPAEGRFGPAALFWLPETRQETAIARIVPLPVRRPAELTRLGAVEALRRAERLAGRRTALVTAPAQPEDTRTFFEKLLGVEKPATPAPALAYAALENGAAEAVARRPLTAPKAMPGGDGGIAVYDISARSVVLPSGERLEAHSGLGESMDDPRFVHLKMRGSTPPGTYDLTEREAPFHGVRALRLTPVGGSEAVHGRVGLLAHTYLLGPAGASNGCVSFKDYERFLQAYLRGEIRRLVVIPGSAPETSPQVAQR
ncbi:DUF2778 domain-containing protein [Methylorubrum zatmanii]|uniref:DUF2778 domain-containing protein n=1 Tax=Methylorubrum zatmanii TaxID=29429 RepID=A0ABW1WQR8_9HYPH|nr:DUF2778 domain-containing protein [Methylorubrum zatmanii]MBD8905269.1 hypothetical protein [Methylorubrum zatmanii]